MHRRLAIRGVVHGVGFRPWVWQQASSLGVVGWVRDTGAGVEIDLHGEAARLDALQARLWLAPSPVRIEVVEVVPVKQAEESAPAEPAPAQPSEIQASVEGTQARAAVIGTDLGVCKRCLAEVFDPANRRWLHPFANCPQCGPRYTVTRNLPFDRAHTSMARFPTCAACDAEYHDSGNRRYHHQTNACPACGPRLWLRTPNGRMNTQDPVAAALHLLRDGGIVAIKGTGGIHLCGDARQAATVARLRQRKQRPTQPLAVMMANVESVKPWAMVNAHEQHWLQSPERPVVLLRQTDRARTELAALAPGLGTLGVMLPYSAVYHLVFHEARGRPTHAGWSKETSDFMLVTTSGNTPGSPVVIDNDTALLELAEMADAWLLHDRDILARNDDSVLRVRRDGTACFLRRGRGHEPTPIALPAVDRPSEDDATEAAVMPSVLALGGLNDATVCITQRERALVSPHVGDLDSIDTRLTYARLADLWPGWLGTQPDALACDLHPDFFSSILAAHLSHTRASTSSGVAPLRVVPVQHHHAHVAAVLAEHPDQKAALAPVIGLVIDGHGLGSDGQGWGGELLRVEGGEAQRVGHLLPMLQPGGDIATREPWRMTAAVLRELSREQEVGQRFERHPPSGALQTWLGRPHAHASHTTSLARLLDAAAGMLDVLYPRIAADYHAEAAMRLESLACEAWPADALDGGWHITDDMVLDWRPLAAWLAEQTAPASSPGRADKARLAAVFHATLAEALAAWTLRAAKAHGVNTVVLAGACMANALLDEALHERLTASNLKVWRAGQYPCGDGGLSLGQAWVARLQLTAHQQH